MLKKFYSAIKMATNQTTEYFLSFKDNTGKSTSGCHVALDGISDVWEFRFIDTAGKPLTEPSIYNPLKSDFDQLTLQTALLDLVSLKTDLTILRNQLHTQKLPTLSNVGNPDQTGGPPTPPPEYSSILEDQPVSNDIRSGEESSELNLHPPHYSLPALIIWSLLNSPCKCYSTAKYGMQSAESIADFLAKCFPYYRTTASRQQTIAKINHCLAINDNIFMSVPLKRTGINSQLWTLHPKAVTHVIDTEWNYRTQTFRKIK